MGISDNKVIALIEFANFSFLMAVLIVLAYTLFNGKRDGAEIVLVKILKHAWQLIGCEKRDPLLSKILNELVIYRQVCAPDPLPRPPLQKQWPIWSRAGFVRDDLGSSLENFRRNQRLLDAGEQRHHGERTAVLHYNVGRSDGYLDTEPDCSV